MWKRMIAMLAATFAIVAGLGFVKVKQVQNMIAQGAAYQPPPEAVTTIVAAREQWPSTLTAIGTVAAVRGVTVSAPHIPGRPPQAPGPGRPVRGPPAGPHRQPERATPGDSCARSARSREPDTRS